MPNKTSSGDVLSSLPPPQPKQVEFLLARERYIGYGGARGGGKTWVVRIKAHLLCMRYAGIKILILRRTFPELEQNHIVPLSEIAGSSARYIESKKTLLYDNGSKIFFGYADTERDIHRYQGQEYDVIFIDEATHFLEYVFTKLKACVRGVNDFPKRIYLTCNPGGVGHSWFKRLFIDRKFKAREKPEDYKFIQALVYDNKALIDSDPGYVEELESLPDGLRQMWLEGKWDVSDGSFFAEFSRDVNVMSPIELSPDFRYYVAIDYGLDALAAVIVAVDTLGNEYVVRELEESGLIVSDAAKALLEFTSDLKIYEWYAPPDLYSRQKDSGKSIIELFHEGGINFVKADNNRCAGWFNIKERLKGCTYPDTGGKVRSRLRIFDTCKKLIEYLPLLQISKRNPNDCDTEPHEITHICDALRYYCVMHTSAPKVKTEVSLLEDYKRKALGHSRSSRSKRF
jgi:phage terminase large subunit